MDRHPVPYVRHLPQLRCKGDPLSLAVLVPDYQVTGLFKEIG